LLAIGSMNAACLLFLGLQNLILTKNLLIAHPWTFSIRQFARFAHCGATPWIYLLTIKSLRKSIRQIFEQIHVTFSSSQNNFVEPIATSSAV
jgi:hypothetical protein